MFGFKGVAFEVPEEQAKGRKHSNQGSKKLVNTANIYIALYSLYRTFIEK